MTYGTADGVGGLSPTFSDDGSFYDDAISQTATKPTLTQVEEWLAQVSSLMDTALSDEGFTVPITNTSVLPEINLLVNGITKDLVDYSRKSGRFYAKRSLDAGTSPFMAIDEELHEWVKRKTQGFVNLGVPRPDAARSQATFDLL